MGRPQSAVDWVTEGWKAIGFGLLVMFVAFAAMFLCCAIGELYWEVRGWQWHETFLPDDRDRYMWAMMKSGAAVIGCVLGGLVAIIGGPYVLAHYIDTRRQKAARDEWDGYIQGL